MRFHTTLSLLPVQAVFTESSAEVLQVEKEEMGVLGV